MNRTVLFLTGAGVGGGLMFLLDPDRGRHRRAYVRDKATATWHDTGDAIRKTARDAGNRAYGTYAAARSRFHGDADPERLLERIHARIGHVVDNPRSIRMAIENGTLVVSGAILARQAQPLLKAIAHIWGDRKMDNRLDLREEEAEAAAEGTGAGHSRAWRAATGAAGGALAVFGLTHRRQLLGRAASAAGFGLLAKSATNRGFRTLLKAVHIAA